MSWATICGSELYNPFCLNGTPSDPYSWVYVSGTWKKATIWVPGNTTINYLDVVQNNGQYLVCTNEDILPCDGWNASTGPVAAANGMTLLSTFQGVTNPALQCTISGPPQPDPQTGTCLKSPLSGPDAACVNPCIRLNNGTLAVNKNSNQCRVFPGTTDGGIAGGIVFESKQCTTVCPQTCVELWETCPPGTAPVSTLIQTKSPADVLSLTGPYLKSSTPQSIKENPLWPKEYATQFDGKGPIGGKPYTECYSFNTEICEMPMARMETSPAIPAKDKEPAVPPITRCYATCPAGTFQDPNDSKLCLFKPTNPDVVYHPDTQANDPKNAEYGPTTSVQRVFCNPQFYNPAYWDDKEPGPTAGSLVPVFPGYTGTQKGCRVLELPTKQGSSCGVGLLPIINDNFNLEWCMPECPTGYFSDLSQSTCVATCQGSTGNSGSSNVIIPGSTVGYNPFLDYVDFYATTNRCKESEYDLTFQQDCAQNYVHGRCPSLQTAPLTSASLQFNDSTNAPDVLLNYKSLNLQCSEKRVKNGSLLKADHETKLALYNSIQKYQTNYPNGPRSSIYGATNYASCPSGMVIGDTDCSENSNLCYDACMKGYEPATTCKSGAATCSDDDLVFVCRAKCPDPEEGLGPWKEVSSGPLYTCAYSYPQEKVPSDPTLWVQCPDDGRYTVLQSSPTDISLLPVARTGPLCVRKTYLRQSACPVSMNPLTDAVTGQTTCTAACNANDIIITLDDGSVVCQSVVNQTSKLQQDFVAIADSNRAKPQFRHRTMTRLNITRGYGTDPNVGVPDPSASKQPQWASFLQWGLLAGALIFAISFLLPKKSSK